jgi:hypothetical protein
MLLLFIGMVIQIRNVQAEREKQWNSLTSDSLAQLESSKERLDLELKELAQKAADLRKKRRAGTYGAGLAEELERLEAEREQIASVVTRRKASRAPGSDVGQVLGSTLAIDYSTRQAGPSEPTNPGGRRVFIEGTNVEESPLQSALAQAGLDPGFRTELELIALGDYRPKDALEILDLVRHQDPRRPIDLTVRQAGRETRLSVRALARPISEEHPLHLPGGVRDLWVLVHSDPNEGTHLAALLGDVLRWHEEIQTVRILRMGSKLEFLSPRPTDTAVLREELSNFLPRLGSRLSESEASPPDVRAALGLLLETSGFVHGSHVLVFLTRPPPDPRLSLEGSLRLAQRANAAISGIALRGHASEGAAEFLALLARETGGGFLGVAP